MTVRLPLRNRSGDIVAFTIVDDEERLPEGWRLSATGYVVSAHEGRTIFLHRVILGLTDDDPRDGDHINRDPLDNRRSNLRIVTHAENCQNRRLIGGSSTFRGVAWHAATQLWQAWGKLNGEQVHLGLYDNELGAAVAAEAYRREHLPFAEPDPRLAGVPPVAPVPKRERNANTEKTHCKRGHPLSGENLYVNATSGARVCRTCQLANQRAAYARKIPAAVK